MLEVAKQGTRPGENCFHLTFLNKKFHSCIQHTHSYTYAYSQVTMAEVPGVVSPMSGVEEQEQQQAAIQPYITPEYYNSLRHFQVINLILSQAGLEINLPKLYLVCAHVPISLLSEPYPLTRKRLSQHLCMFASCDFTLLTLCRTISWLVELLTQHN